MSFLEKYYFECEERDLSFKPARYFEMVGKKEVIISRIDVVEKFVTFYLDQSGGDWEEVWENVRFDAENFFRFSYSWIVE